MHVLHSLNSTGPLSAYSILVTFSRGCHEDATRETASVEFKLYHTYDVNFVYNMASYIRERSYRASHLTSPHRD